MRYLIGIDGGGTRTTLALADEHGRELLRREGPAGLVDPRQPTASAGVLLALAREAVAEVGLTGPAAALCAGLAGVGNPAERETVRAALARTGVAERIEVISDGEIALHGALGEEAGILLIAGTGSVAYGRAEDGRVERCGGWGMMLGDEGSGYAIGRDALRAALYAADGRGPRTRLLPDLLNVLSLADPREIPSWVGRTEKSQVAGLATYVLRLAEGGDAVAGRILADAAEELVRHAAALSRRLGPWSSPPAIVLHGGMTRQVLYARLVRTALEEEISCAVREAAADAVCGALDYARRLASGRECRAPSVVSSSPVLTSEV